MTEKKPNVVPYYTNMLIIGAIIGTCWVAQSSNDTRISQLEKRIIPLEKQVEFFQRLWENVPEEYRREVSP